MSGKYPWIAALILCLTILVLAQSPTYAHRMLIRPVTPGQLQIIFDDGTSASAADVAFYDRDGNDLLRSKADQDGNVGYDTSLPIARVVANDGAGHRATWNYGDEFRVPSSRWPKIVLIASLFLFIAALFQRKYATSQISR